MSTGSLGNDILAALKEGPLTTRELCIRFRKFSSDDIDKALLKLQSEGLTTHHVPTGLNRRIY